jgi:hypothetical protein
MGPDKEKDGAMQHPFPTAGGGDKKNYSAQVGAAAEGSIVHHLLHMLGPQRRQFTLHTPAYGPQSSQWVLMGWWHAQL